MLIIREKPDYYDSSIGFGVDKTVVYNRKACLVEDPLVRSDILAAIERVDAQNPFLRRSLFSPFHVGFCGRIYTGTYTHVDPKTGELKGQVYRYDPNELETRHYWVEKDYPSEQLDRNGKSGFYLWDGKRPTTKTIREWLGKLSQGVESQQVFLNHRLVCFVSIGREIIIDPCLKDLGFQRVVGGVEAFQEIMMFISGVLGMLEKDVGVTEDKYIALSKGFDKHSFRKAATKRI